ncbi:MAG: hypothetical protein AAGD38_07905 [Acidobacteriota bacterium]
MKKATLTGIFILLAWCASLELRTPFFFLQDDNATYFLSAYAHNTRALDQGELAQINLHQYLGQSHLGAGQTAVLYPPVYVAAWVARGLGDARWMITLLVIAHLVAAIIGMAMLLRSWRVPPWWAIGGGLWWATLPFVSVASRGWVFIAFLAALLPWKLWLLDRLLRRADPLGFVALAAVNALTLLQGHVQWAVMAALFDVLYVVLIWLMSSAYRRRWRGGLAVLMAHGVGGLLAAPMLLPMIEVVMRSADRATALASRDGLALPMSPVDFLLGQVFLFRSGAAHQASSAIFYLGLPMLVVLLVAMLPRHSRSMSVDDARARALTCLAFTALVLATPAQAVLRSLPPFDLFRWPFKYMLFAGFFTAVCVGLTLPRWARRGSMLRKVTPWILISGIGVHLVLSLHPDTSRAFGRFTLDRSVEQLGTDTAAVLDAEKGRVISLWQSVSEPELSRHLTHQFATLAEASHLGGYDPLIARVNKRLALGLEYSNIYRFELTPGRRDHLDRWAVRWWLAPPRYAHVLDAFPEVERRHVDDSLGVWENLRARPLVMWRDDPSRTVVADWGVNGVRIATYGGAGQLMIALAPLPWYFWSADGIPMGAVTWSDEEQMVLDIAPGTREVTVRYESVPFRIGSTVATTTMIGLIGLVWLAYRRRRKLSDRA